MKYGCDDLCEDYAPVIIEGQGYFYLVRHLLAVAADWPTPLWQVTLWPRLAAADDWMVQIRPLCGGMFYDV